jgi:ribosomal protein L37E
MESVLPQLPEAIGTIDVDVVPCRDCGARQPTARRRCDACGFSADELRRWRGRNLASWRRLAAQLRWNTWEVWVFIVVRTAPAAAGLIILPSLSFQEGTRIFPLILRFSSPIVAVVGAIVVGRVDLALRDLPTWTTPGQGDRSRLDRWFGRWWPGAIAWFVSGHVLGRLIAYRFAGWYVVHWIGVCLLAAMTVGAAASLAIAAGRMDGWASLIAPSAQDFGRQARPDGPRTVLRVFACWAVLAGLLMAGTRWRLGGEQSSTVWHVGNFIVDAIYWSAGLVWLWNLLVVQRSLRRWVND